MEDKKKTNLAADGPPVKPDAAGNPGAPEESAAANPYAPRNLTFAENVILTVKVLAALGLIGAALWIIRILTSAK